MKKILFLPILAFALIFSGCNKVKDEANTDPASGQGSVVFSGKVIDNGLKNLLDTDYIAEYALVTISGTVYEVGVYYIDDMPYTEAIKLDPGTYTVEQFLMYDDNETPGDKTDDVLIWATPEAGSEFAEFVVQPVPFDITVEAFMKHEIFIEVLRFIPDVWEEFGFIWFAVEESVIREQCFFGDICVYDPDDYIGSLYENQQNGLQVDMPAIAKIEVWQNTSKYPNQGYELMGEFDNEDWYGEGAPLCVRYKDYVLYEDMFEFRLFILVAVGDGFDYVHFQTWTFVDDEMIPDGDDGIVDYVLGDCVPVADFFLTYWGGSETAYAYTDNENIPCECFIDMGIGNNWGWHLGLFNYDYTFDLYAGAGGCDINNGTHVGEVFVDFKDGDLVDVTYNMYYGYTLDEAQLWMGYDIYPGPPCAPGQFPYKAEDLGGVSTYTFDDKPFVGNIYMIAHAVVDGL